MTIENQLTFLLAGTSDEYEQIVFKLVQSYLVKCFKTVLIMEM